jgi:hypothetical protein
MRALPTRLGRVARMTPAEISARVAMAVRRGADRVVHASRKPAWHRRDLVSALATDAPGVAEAAAALDGGDDSAAHVALSRHFATRPRRWPIAPSGRDALVAVIRARFPQAAADATTRARAIADGRFDLLGYRALEFGSPIDWHLDPVHGRVAPRRFWTDVPYLSEACGDHKIVWELNRHQHWLALGRAHWLSADRRAAATFTDHLAGWLAANPPLIGMNWASMLELAFRAISWIWALHFFTDAAPASGAAADGTREDPWTVDLLLGLDRQLRLVEGNLSTWFSPNTHLIGEALALYVAGRALPELRRAPVWARVGRRVLIEEIARQITDDGGHAERSFHYHRYTLDFYLLALAVARLTGDDAAPFGEAAQRLARFARIVADDRGRLARVGDDDGGQLFPICGREAADASDSLGVAAWLLQDPSLAVGPPTEEALWMAGEEAASVRTPPGVPLAVRSISLEASGYTVCRSPRGDHLVFDAGPHGFLNGGHAHADALSIVLTVAGRPFLIDPGTASYTIDREARDRFRSTRLHNTLTLDGRSQSTPSGSFHWATTTAATRGAWRSAEGLDVVDGWHDGYAPIRHARAITARRGCWIVEDRVEGGGRHRAELHWHVDPAWTVEVVDAALARARHASGARVWIVSPDAPLERFTGSTMSPELGWHSPVYGVVEPCTTLRAAREAEAPFGIRTVIIEGDDLPDEFRQRAC